MLIYVNEFKLRSTTCTSQLVMHDGEIADDIERILIFTDGADFFAAADVKPRFCIWWCGLHHCQTRLSDAALISRIVRLARRPVAVAHWIIYGVVFRRLVCPDERTYTRLFHAATGQPELITAINACIQHMPNDSYGCYRKHGRYVRVYIDPHFGVWYQLTNKRKPTQPTVITNDASAWPPKSVSCLDIDTATSKHGLRILTPVPLIELSRSGP